jgi:hypothetical protein
MGQAQAGDVRFSFHVSMRTTKRQEMVFEGDGGWLVVRAPFNAGEYGSGRFAPAPRRWR